MLKMTLQSSHSNENSPVRSDPTIVCVFEGLQLPYDDSNFNAVTILRMLTSGSSKMITNNVSGTKVVSDGEEKLG